ncbi:hypothetical protein [Pyxidicoccus xibeiensis]|uniref:hypothetical protein n=1 Tax=Pyxidicoccus xibeiensis TaxID=2906759 RepID=UPI0020A7712F|nr:hypothetical protein [Pyxidicoccus xibeiensis]MCP3140544.1 hypothetical protein [Pyxidicoccus xibeiensis]
MGGARAAEEGDLEGTHTGMACVTPRHTAAGSGGVLLEMEAEYAAGGDFFDGTYRSYGRRLARGLARLEARRPGRDLEGER